MLISCAVADLHLCFHICRLLVFPCSCSIYMKEWVAMSITQVKIYWIFKIQAVQRFYYFNPKFQHSIPYSPVFFLLVMTGRKLKTAFLSMIIIYRYDITHQHAMIKYKLNHIFLNLHKKIFTRMVHQGNHQL